MSRELDEQVHEKVMKKPLQEPCESKVTRYEQVGNDKLVREQNRDWMKCEVCGAEALLCDILVHEIKPIPEYSSNMSDAWKVVERMVRIPETLEDARVARNTKFAYWFEKANLWSDTEADAATAICENALRIQADTSNPFDRK